MTGLEVWKFAFLIVIIAALTWIVIHRPAPARGQTRPKPSPRSLKPRTPDREACPFCRATHPAGSHPRPLPKPYRQVKSPRGSKKRVATAGYACPNPNCLYFGIIDDQIHALVGCGHHGRQERIHAARLRCQACRTKFSVRLGTVLYRLKTPAHRVAEVLGALAEGVSLGAATRIFGHSEFTLRAWLTRAGLHATTLYERFFCNLKLLQVQRDAAEPSAPRPVRVLNTCGFGSLWMLLPSSFRCLKLGLAPSRSRMLWSMTLSKSWLPITYLPSPAMA